MSDCSLAPSQQFFPYHGENQLISNEMIMRSTLYYANTLSWIFMVLTHWNNSLRIAMPPHSDTLYWFRANTSLFFLFYVACLAEKQDILIL